MAISAAILAGGQARRLAGVDKGLLTIGSTTIFDRQVAVLKPLVDEILLVTGEPDRYRAIAGVRRVRDRQPGRGPLAGLQAAWHETNADALLVFGCDLPFLDERLVRMVRDELPDSAAVVPRVGDRLQPLHARYPRSSLTVIEQRLEQGALRLTELLQDLCVVEVEERRLRVLDPDLLGLCNVNTPEELAQAREWEARRAGRPSR